MSISKFMKTGLANVMREMLLKNPTNMIAIVTYHWDVELIAHILYAFLQTLGNEAELAQRIFIRVLPLKWMPGRSGSPAVCEPSRDDCYLGKNFQIYNVLHALHTLGIHTVNEVILIDDSAKNIEQFQTIPGSLASFGVGHHEAIPRVNRFGFLEVEAGDPSFSTTEGVRYLAP